LINRVLAERRILPDRAIWFEHGAAHAGSPVSCGVDHAHLHIIVDAPFSFMEFTAAVTAASTLCWRERPPHEVYQDIKAGTSYLFTANSQQSMFAEEADSVGSQFLRRVIARLVDQPTRWNYKTHPHLENIHQTIRAFTS
jgi:ATP adenylyltransferase